MYFTSEDGDEIKLSAVIMVSKLIGEQGRKYYTAHLIGGQHVTVKESFMARDSFVSNWKGQ